MSAINVLRQRSSVHLITDMAAYDGAGMLHFVDHRKCFSLPGMKAAVACTGPAALGGYLAETIPSRARSFDDLVQDAEHLIPAWFEEYARAERGGDAFSTLYLIGWLEKSARPAAYGMDMWTNGCSRLQLVADNSPNFERESRFKLKEQLLAGTPLPDLSLCAQAGFDIPDDENIMVPERDLLHLLEIQRRDRIEGAFWVGGGAWLTSIDARSIKQRVVHTWEEDRVGSPITPLPIDWTAWRSSREAAPFMDRLRRRVQGWRARLG